MRIFQKGFHFGQDGPGNRLVYHLQGCNMHCPWCSNPEGMSPSGGTEHTLRELLDECRRSRMMFFSGGGVTFTGGEATVQHDELLALLRALRDEGIHTALETNGTSPRLSLLLPYIDYLIMDFKHWDGEVLRRVTGVDAVNVRNNYEQGCKEGRRQHIRIPLIHGFNTDAPEAFAAYFSAFDTSHTVFELLPYHEYGRNKWRTPYLVTDGFVPPECLARFRQVFTEHGLTLVVT